MREESPTPPWKASTIEEVITKLDELIAWAVPEENRICYFAALYKRVTQAVKHHCDAGSFEDNERMRQLDVVFANRFLEAWHIHQTGGTPTKCWQVAFMAAIDDKPIVLQHLMVGMNAHISLDLGVAAGEVAPGPKVHNLKDDFYQINTVLFSLIDLVQEELAQIFKPFALIDRLMGRADERMAKMSMRFFRGKAWKVAVTMAAAQGGDVHGQIARIDEEVVKFGQRLYQPGWPLRGAMRRIRSKEVGDVATKCAILNAPSPKDLTSLPAKEPSNGTHP